jgi:hypothetical protein
MVTTREVAVDVGTIAIPLLVLGAFALFLVMLRRLPPAEDDVAAVVAGVLRTPAGLEPPPADVEEPIRWRLELLRPRAADRSKQSELTKPLTAAHAYLIGNAAGPDEETHGLFGSITAP